MNNKAFWLIGILGVLIVGLFAVGIVFANKASEDFQNHTATETEPKIADAIAEDLAQLEQPEQPTVGHLETPNPVKALYMSAWVASTPSMREKIIELVDTTEINAVVIDIKDATGRVSFLVEDPIIAETGSPRDLIKNITELIESLHEKNIYVIGRISVFQDPYMTELKPQWAIKSKSTGKIWKDRKGLSFLDPTNESVWEYTIRLAQASYAKGFDEINFDYIRFPSDGNMTDIAYPEGITSKSDAIKKFWEHVHQKMTVESKIPTSADVFGLTTEAADDMGIGQVLENALPNFDYIAPMIYPSHYASGYQGFKNPAVKPYEVVSSAMKSGISRAQVMGMDASKFRPWIQDFDLGATYTADMVRAQIRALQEIGINSFMVWDPANSYTQGAYNKD